MRSPRRETSGVSPVVAVVLLVAITVILSTAMYLVVSNLTVRIGDPGRLAAVVERSGDGTNWIIRIVAVQRTFSVDTTYIVVRGLGGETLLGHTALGSLDGFIDLTEPGFVSPGDTLNLPTSLYPADSAYQLMDDTLVLFQGILR